MVDFTMSKSEPLELAQTHVHWVGGWIITYSLDMSKLWELVLDQEDWRAAVHGVPKSRTWLSDGTELKS